MNPETNALPEVKKFVEQREKKDNIQLENLEGLTFPELTPFLEEIVHLTSSWNPVEIYTATNAKTQKESFLKNYRETGDADNPQFNYELADKLDFSEAKNHLLQIRREIMALAKQIKNSEASDNQKTKLKYLACVLAILKVNDDLTTANMLEGIKSKNDSQTKLALDQKYGKGLSEALITEAENIYQQKVAESDKTKISTQQKPDKSSEINEATEVEKQSPILSREEQEWLLSQEFNAEQIADVFNWALERYGFLAKEAGDFGFIVKIDPRATSIDVRDKNQSEQPTIVIPDNRLINGKNLLSLIGHEIESHARQSMNGAKLFAFGGGKLKIDGEAPYEGLAKQADIRFAHDYFGESSPTPLPYYIKAIELAQSGKTFKEVFAEMVKLRQNVAHKTELTDKILDGAWSTTYRVFRGSSDPENKAHYAMPKDKAYVEGFLLSKQLKDLGYDQYNQMAITTGAGIKMLGLFDVKPTDIPYPNLDLQREYWEKFLKPKFEQSQKQDSSEIP